mgnify:FL=1
MNIVAIALIIQKNYMKGYTMRQINRKHYNIITVNPDIHGNHLRLICGISGEGISAICNLILINGGIDIIFPLEIHVFHGFAKNIFYKSKKLRNGHKLEIQCYFKDILNTGISICHKVPDSDLDVRSYISISMLGFTVYIADSYYLPIPH